MTDAFAPDWRSLCHDWFPTGSRYICNPPPMDTDEDFCALVPASADMKALGFRQDGSPDFYTGNDNGGFRSWRRGSLNVITTEDVDFFKMFKAATALAKHLNLTEKRDRIALFQAVLYGVKAEDLEISPMRPAGCPQMESPT
jgi:hypothetical protein